MRCPEMYGGRNSDISTHGQVQGLNAKPWPLGSFVLPSCLKKRKKTLSGALLTDTHPSYWCPPQPLRSLSLPCPSSLSPSPDSFSVPTQISTFPRKYSLSLSLSLPALGSTKLLKWMVSAIHSLFYFLLLHTHYRKTSLIPTSTCCGLLPVLNLLDKVAAFAAPRFLSPY